MRKGFTLAEVLVTLSIIGTVAAMTLPSLINKHRKVEVVTKLEKFYSVFNQAIKMSEAEYGDVEGWFKDCGPSTAPTCTSEEVKEWFEHYIGKHMHVLKTEINTDKTGILVYLNNGSIIRMPNYIYDTGLFINKKALDNPINGINSFGFRFNPKLNTGQTSGNEYTIKKTLEPYTWSWNGTREGLLHTSNGYGCGETQNAFCTKLIQYDGWQIADDYPLKF